MTLGTSTAEKSVSQLAGMVALQFQNPDDQICKGSVWEETAFGPRNLGYPEDMVRRLVHEYLHALGLLHMRKWNPHDLGLSERKRLAVASVLAMDTQIVVLDEPNAGLDPRELMMLESTLRRLESEGKTVVVISHDMDFIAENMIRAIWLENGCIRFDGNIVDLFNRNSIVEHSGFISPQMARLGSRLGLTLRALTPEGVIEAMNTLHKNRPPHGTSTSK